MQGTADKTLDLRTEGATKISKLKKNSRLA